MTIHFTSFPWALITCYTIMAVFAGMFIGEKLIRKSK